MSVPSCSSDIRIFLPPSPGKPNPIEPLTDGRDSRSRVPFSLQKGNTCFYYAAALLRRRYRGEIGKEMCEGREIEKIISLWRKSMTPEILMEEDYRSKIDVIFLLLTRLGVRVDGVERLAEGKERFWLNLFPNEGEEAHRFHKEVVDPKKNFPKLHSLACRIIALKYKLKDAVWCPTQSIESLIIELQTKGPMLVSGRFGSAFYESQISEMKGVMEGHRFFYFKASESKRKGGMEFYSHAIVIIGAEKKDSKEFVYFIDPDFQMPEVSSRQVLDFPIQIISYTNLQTHCFQPFEEIGLVYTGSTPKLDS